MAAWPPDNVLVAAVEPPAPVLFVLSTIAIFCLTFFSTFIRSAKKSIVEHVIVVTFAFAVVDAATGCVARDKSGGSRG